MIDDLSLEFLVLLRDISFNGSTMDLEIQITASNLSIFFKYRQYLAFEIIQIFKQEVQPNLFLAQKHHVIKCCSQYTKICVWRVLCEHVLAQNFLSISP